MDQLTSIVEGKELTVTPSPPESPLGSIRRSLRPASKHKAVAMRGRFIRSKSSVETANDFLVYTHMRQLQQVTTKWHVMMMS
jgi:hypothetical protein